MGMGTAVTSIHSLVSLCKCVAVVCFFCRRCRHCLNNYYYFFLFMMLLDTKHTQDQGIRKHNMERVQVHVPAYLCMRIVHVDRFQYQYQCVKVINVPFQTKSVHYGQTSRATQMHFQKKSFHRL